jgi:hypothetical protein
MGWTFSRTNVAVLLLRIQVTGSNDVLCSGLFVPFVVLLFLSRQMLEQYLE